MNLDRYSALVFSFSLLAGVVNAQDGANDPTFNPTDLGFGQGDGASSTVRGISVRPDGKILIWGDFSSYNFKASNRLARLNANGTSDYSFNYTNLNGDLHALTVQPDDKILVGGDFTYVDGGTPLQRIMRLNADGSRDHTFMLPGNGANDRVRAIGIQSDGKVIIAGDFNLFNSTARNRIARLSATGTLDGTFNPGAGADSTINALVVQPDGSLLIAGAFTGYDGTSVGRIARLDANADVDPAFISGTGADGTVHTMVVLPDGKIMIGGDFMSYDGTQRNGIARLNADGSLDIGFDPGAGVDASVLAIALQPDGRCVIGGAFTTYDGGAIPHMTRLNTDGTVDAQFTVGDGPNEVVRGIAVKPDGSILAGGEFTRYDGILLERIALVQADGSLDSSFNPNTGADGYVETMVVLDDDRIIIGGTFTRYNGVPCNRITRLNPDGTLDPTFQVGSGANSWVNSMALADDGKLLVGGSFDTFNGFPRLSLVRLWPDGSVDEGFVPPATSAGNAAFAILPLPGGQVLVGGPYYNGSAAGFRAIWQLNDNGTIADDFDCEVSDYVLAMARQADGKILVGKYTAPRLLRLNADGSLDASFDTGTGPNDRPNAIVVQPDGKILIGGEFLSYNGTFTGSITRLEPDGGLDGTFDTGAGPSGSYAKTQALLLHDNGRIMVGGNFLTFDGQPRQGIARLEPNGALDTSFDPGIGAQTGTGSGGSSLLVQHFGLQSDGNLLISGGFTSYDGFGRNRIARVISDISTNVPLLTIGTSHVFPSPTAGPFTVSTDLRGPLLINITDITGKVVWSIERNFSNNLLLEVDLSGQTPGLYLVRVAGQDRSVTTQLIKE